VALLILDEEVTMGADNMARVGVAVGMALALGGCTSSPEPDRVVPAAATTDSSRTTGAVHLVDYAINSDGPASSAILTGAIGDFGTGETVNPDGSPDPDHTSQLKLALRQGTFRLDIATLDARLVKAYQRFPADPRTCSGSVTVGAAVPVVSGGGTGAYKGLHGSFELTAMVDEVDSPPCDGTGAFTAQTIIISGSGTVSGTAS
jgi:hypothetical protein